MKQYFFISFFLCMYSSALSKPSKIVGLMRIRNEAPIIEQSLRALAAYTDAIVVTDDASEDATLSIIRSLAKECRIEKIIEKKEWRYDESGDQNLLLSAGREMGGTHFIVIDADEIITANCMHRNFLRNIILRLNPGDRLGLYWFQLWKGAHQYRLHEPGMKEFIFCDDGIASYPTHYIHSPRVPHSTQGVLLLLQNTDYGVMHFESINYHHLSIKYAWYKCLQRVRNPNVQAQELSQFYAKLLDDTNVILHPTHTFWFAYPFFNEQAFHAPRWEETQIARWIQQYGADYFATFDIADFVSASSAITA